MLISIIVAVYNGAETLQYCIDSITQQTYPSTELIVIDGGSTDGTVEILKANVDRIAYWQSEPDRGIYDAWNQAIDHVQGEWIYFLGADDYFWSDDVLARMVPHLSSAGEKVKIVYGKVAMVSKKGDVLEVHGRSWNESKRLFLKGRCLPHQGVFHHCSLFTRYKKFDSSFQVAGDYEFLLRELKQADAHFVDVIVAGQRMGGKCNTPAYELQSLREFARAQEKNLGKTSLLLKWKFIIVFSKKVLRSAIGDRAADYCIDFCRVMAGRPAIWTRYRDGKT
jgi:glycosyltransferase involved in cell wall biosynthesis